MDRIETDNWSDRIEDVLARCERATTDPADVIIEIHGLLSSGPTHICDDIKPTITGRELRHLLEVNAFESAALRLIEKCGYMLSGSCEGLTIASVVLPQAARDYSFSASSCAIALCGALVTSIHEIDDANMAD